MLVFVDESGDAGFSLKQGSSSTFVIACVIFTDDLEAEKTAVAIKELRRMLGFSDRSEFKFNGSRKAVRRAFLSTVSAYDFTIRAIVVHKKDIHSEYLKNNKNEFYSYFIKMLLSNADGKISNADLRIDGSGDRAFRRQFLSYLRRQLNTDERRVMRSAKMVDSAQNVLIQLADMAAGVIRRHEEQGKTDSNEYFELIASKVSNLWKFK